MHFEKSGCSQSTLCARLVTAALQRVDSQTPACPISHPNNAKSGTTLCAKRASASAPRRVEMGASNGPHYLKSHILQLKEHVTSM